MKIDPRFQVPGDAQPERVSGKRNGAVNSKGSAPTSGLRPVSGEDTVSLSSRHGEVQQLTAAAANVPEVRANRVEALQQQVRHNRYQPDNQKLADALLADAATRKKHS